MDKNYKFYDVCTGFFFKLHSYVLINIHVYALISDQKTARPKRKQSQKIKVQLITWQRRFLYICSKISFYA